jgi:Carboxypeptidase regulatory-like domain
MKRLFGILVVLFVAVTLSFGQAISAGGGSIQGAITDQTNAVVPNATVVIRSPQTGFSRTITTDSAGFYSVGPLNPGPYAVTVTATGFRTLTVNTVIQTGTVTSGSFKLTVGESSVTVEVTAGVVQVNTDQPGVSDVLSRQQIEALPLNGRNILDAAQVQPGVILQSGETFDPTKAGYSAISVGGVSGRTTRILLDGQDITDETVGTTLFNVPTGAVQEFQLNRSTQDVSGEVTSTGQMLISTQSGTNGYHGQLFYLFQDHRAGFARTTGGFDAPFQRNQFGGSVGGPILRDKLFFFADVERVKQDEEGSATTSPTFNDPTNLSPTQSAPILQAFPSIPSPFRDTYSTGRLDWNGPKGAHLFFRASYNVNADSSNFGQLYSLYKTRNNTPAFVGGVDFATKRFTHSIRGSYVKFHNLLGDGTGGLTSIYNPLPDVGGGVTLYNSTDGFYAGPNYLAPQGTFQSNKQLRYDGTWTKGAHTVKFGASMSRIQGGGFAAFYGASLFTRFSGANLLTGPTADDPEAAGCFGNPGAAPCAGDPINGYSVRYYRLGNGNGFFTEKPGFGLKGGGTDSWRIASYIGDTWKVAPFFTLSAGLRWSVDTNRGNQDLSTPLCSSVDPSLQFPGCTGDTPLFDQYQQGLGKKTHQPWANFGPQVGFVFSPGDHKTSVRAGIGIFYESNVFNNTGNARSSVVNADGNYFNYAQVCGGTNVLVLPDGTNVSSVNGVPLSTICGESIAQSAPQIAQLRAQYQAASQTGGPNPAYIGSVGGGLFANGIYGNPYLSPYAIQFNGGVEREIARGTVLSVDYVHNATIKVPMLIDVNHVGAARYLNVAAAQAAIAATTNSFGCTGGTSAAAINCAIGAGALITDFAGNGLDSSNQYTGSVPVSETGQAPAAFAGANPNVGQGLFILPVGRSGYDALQIVLRQQVVHPVRGINASTFQISYALSRIVNPVNASESGDQFFNSLPFDYDDPNQYMGRPNLDHTNQLSFGGSIAVKYGLNVALIGHFYSAGATSLTLDQGSGDAGEIFRTDVTGDGSTGDLVPGTLPGDYMHRIKGSGLNRLINNYNAANAGQPTPAGRALIGAGLLTLQQLQALNGVQQQIATAPTTPIGNPAFRAFDATISYPIHLSRLHEGMSLEPAVSMYNLANMSNFGRLSGILANTATAGGAVGTTNSFLNGPNNSSVYDGSPRTQRGSGTFAAGAPRTTEFSLKLNF